jgi:DNA polymerase-3 subunit gamma/tau
VKFEEILGQLKDLVAREQLEADEDALALVAEGGDGSIRDALSILDQAIASSSGRLSLDEVRQLVGAAPSGVLEQIMQSVAQSSSEDVLRVVDQLISEGHSPTHFARQMVRFLRNTVVAKIAGADSSLLQISGDERKRVARVAELFSEEDLARHLQIMLRTHSELGYRQEQRFHLELGLLKMAHAQRLLPIEQLLSEAGVGNVHRPAGKPSIVPEARKSEASPTSRPNYVSPFAADSARKGVSKPELSTENSAPVPSKVAARTTNPPVVMGAAAPAAMSEPVEEISAQANSVPEIQAAEQLSLSTTVLDALGSAGHRVLVSLLDGGEWQVEGDELQVKVTASAAVVDMSLSAEAKRLLTATATQVLRRPVKLKIIPGSNVQAAPANRRASNGGGRTRVEQDPVVRRMQEKFGAEIRTVIDYREKR